MRKPIFGLLLVLPLACHPSTTASQIAMGDAEGLQPGIVVEKVAKNSQAEKAGLQEGDILLEWTRAGAKGTIVSPFDFAQIEIEQAPRGTVTLAGVRGATKRTWTTGPGEWGIEVRPNFHGPLLVSYLKATELVKTGRSAEASEHGLVAAGRESSPAWLRVWLAFHAAQLLAEAGKDDEADAVFQQALEEAVKASPGLARELQRKWAEKLLQGRDKEGAEKLLRNALAESEKPGEETLTRAAELYDLARVFQNKGDLNNEQSFVEQALAIQKRLAPDSLALADTLLLLAKVTVARGDLPAAETTLLQALKITERLSPGTSRVAQNLWYLGILAGQRLDLAKAEQLLRHAIEIEGKVAPGSRILSSMLGDLGSVVFERGDLVKAEEYYLRELSIANRVAPGTFDVAKPLNNLGNVALERRDLAKAEQYYRQSLAIIEKVRPGSLAIANGLNSLGDVFFQRGDLDSAVNYYKQALAIRESLAPGSLEMAESQNSLADALLARGDSATAEQYYRQALDIRQKLAPGSTLHAETLAALARLERTQQPDAASRLFDQSINALENQVAHLGGAEQVRAGFRAKFSGYYRDYIDLLIAQKRPELAFQVLERLHARSLLETLASAHADIRRGVDGAFLERERSLQAEIADKSDRRLRLLAGPHPQEQIAAIEAEINNLLARYQDAEEQIQASSPGYAALTQPQPLSAKKVRDELLDDDTLLLEYSLGEERSYVFAVGRDSLSAYELPRRTEIERAVRRVYGLLTPRDRNLQGTARGQQQARGRVSEREFATEIVNLSHMVLEPVAAQLKDKRLLIVADGALQYVPFAMLPEPTGGVPRAPLIVKHEIVNLPSASVLAVLRREEQGRPPAPRAVAVLADPVFDARDARVAARSEHVSGSRAAGLKSGKPASVAPSPASDSLTRSAADIGLSRNGRLFLPRLRFSRLEAISIAAVAPADQSVLALDFDANRAAATDPRLTQYRIVHFATHGLLDSEHPELSGLVFSLVDKNGRPQDGFLTLQDIYNLNLPADLVVLSACETGLGKDISGEGLVGLTRGFMYAGASRVVASLWKVSDVATARLMAEFYKAMESEGMSPAQALRAAQIRMWKQKRWHAPYYWAGFQLQGEWK